MSENHLIYLQTDFHKSDPCDIDIRPSNTKSKGGHVLTKTNQQVKYESSVIHNSQVIYSENHFY